MDKGYNICGIQQVGIGVKDLTEAWRWYIQNFGMDCRIFEDKSEARLMLPYTGGEARSRHAVLAINLQSGGGFEIWQYKGREPKMIDEEIQLGDKGILACKMKVKNVGQAYSLFSKNGQAILNEPAADPSGNMNFFMKDPFGNIFQIVPGDKWFMDEKKITGGSYGVIIGVSDIEKARTVYSDILGYDEVVYDSSGVFPDLQNLPGGKNSFRRVLLRSSKPFTGPFSRVFGQSNIELISPLEKQGKKVLEGRFWGDPGFIHICFDINGMDALRTYCANKDFSFTVDSKQSHKGNSFDMGEAAGHFSYIEDPDGTLIEFVETHKVPVLKKIGWYIDLRKRKPLPLPSWILKTLRFSRVRL
ncbi:MAG TPA: VOC family protein [Bacteroidales bacterium]|nr:VOC family protein [Bacteroidales bacterium]HPI67992.1 VOC family protein [Bacteroidales bacterium]HPR72437.1 VOC family protein [Bacteroidales bacterium]